MAILKNINLDNTKRIGGSEFKGVSKYRDANSNTVYKAEIHSTKTGFGWRAFYDNEREAAKNVDIQRIMAGKEPINVLTKLNK